MVKFFFRSFIFFSLFGVSWSVSAQKQRSQKPNIIVILADDMGFSDISCFGSEIHTPNLDKFAENGMRLTNFYNMARCSPSRAALLTGVYPHQAGVGHFTHDLGYPGYQGYLNKNVITLAEGLKTAGYTTIMTGKWHLGNDPGKWPSDRGFEKQFAHVGGTSNFFFPHPLGQPRDEDYFILNGKKLENYTSGKKPDNYYLTDETIDYALRFLEETKDSGKPFFMYTAFNAPHFPLQARAEDIAKYRGKYMKGWDTVRAERYKKQIASGIIKPDVPLSRRDTLIPEWYQMRQSDKEAWDLKMAVYAAMIDRMDYNIGRIMHKLKEIGADQNTLVLFFSDNGASAENASADNPVFASRPAPVRKYVKSLSADNPQSYVAYEYNWANVSNTPLRSYKKYAYEGGISSSFIALFPGKINSGSINSDPIHIVDLQPTLFELAGVKYPKQFNGNKIMPQEGISFLNVLHGKAWAGHDIMFWENEGNCAVRKGDWKAVASYPQKRWELYNVKQDRTEMHNLASSNEEKLKELIFHYEAWAKRAGVVDWDKLKDVAK